MARLAMTVTHRLGNEEAQRRLMDMLGVIRTRYAEHFSDLHEEWNENTLSFAFTAVGMRVVGTLVVEDRKVRLTARVPFAVVIFKRRIEKRIRAELGTLLS